MKAVVIALALLPVSVVNLVAQKRELDQSISVTFAINGKPIKCDNLKVQLLLDGRAIVPKHAGNSFIVPAAFDKKPSEWSPYERAEASVSCGKYELNFPKLDPTWVTAGSWEIGIAYPPYWVERFGWTGATEQGTWLSYLESECNGCDPGVFTTISHPTPPSSLVPLLRHEQASASGQRRRDLAYALAVLNVRYQENRGYLLELLNACRSRSKESPEDDICDGRLLDYVTNLYWRGDSALLTPLLQVADCRKDVIDEIGTFYARLLDRRTEAALKGMQDLPMAKQETICRLAGQDDFSLDAPKFKRVAEHLHAIGGEVADHCLQEAERAAGRPAQ